MSTPTADPEPKLVARVRKRRAQHRRRGRVYRSLVVLAGFLLVLAGIAMLALPGPAFVVIPVGLAILSLEFAWAERLLDRSLVEAARAKGRARDTSPHQKLVSGVLVVAIAAAFVVCALRYDIPLVPVV